MRTHGEIRGLTRMWFLSGICERNRCAHTHTRTQQGSMQCNPCIESCVNGLGFGLPFHMLLVLHSAAHTHTHTLQVSQPVYLACVVVSDGHSSAKPCVSMCDLCHNSSIHDGPIFAGWSPAYSYFGLPSNHGLAEEKGITLVRVHLCSPHHSVHFSPLCWMSKTFSSFVNFLILLSVSTELIPHSVCLSFLVNCLFKIWCTVLSSELFIRCKMIHIWIDNTHLCSFVVIYPNHVLHINSEQLKPMCNCSQIFLQIRWNENRRKRLAGNKIQTPERCLLVVHHSKVLCRKKSFISLETDRFSRENSFCSTCI